MCFLVVHVAHTRAHMHNVAHSTMCASDNFHIVSGCIYIIEAYPLNFVTIRATFPRLILRPRDCLRRWLSLLSTDTFMPFILQCIAFGVQPRPTTMRMKRSELPATTINKQIATTPERYEWLKQKGCVYLLE